MLTTGNQLRAARALVGMTQETLSKKSGVSLPTIYRMETEGPGMLKSEFPTIRKVMVALEKAGVEFLNHGKPGVRLR